MGTKAEPIANTGSQRESAVHPGVIMQPALAHREWVSSDLQARLFEVEVALDAVHSLVADTALVA
jgi:hypothetical protein